MLRKRSRGMTSKQAQMADNGSSVLSPTTKYTKPSPSFFSSPRLFTALSSSKAFFETEVLKSPTSILDNKTFSSLGNPFWSDNKNTITTTTTTTTTTTSNKHPWENKLDSRGIGLAIADVLNDETKTQSFSKPDSPVVLFGSHLKIQIPPFSPYPPSPSESPNSSTDFGIKTPRNSYLDPLSVSPSARKTQFGSVNLGVESAPSPRVFTGCLSASEMESSEDYTCVITHGPNPKTTHIFDDCIVEDCCDVIGLSASKKKKKVDYPSVDFLSFCYTCKKNLGQGKDIYIYRGDKAFCSQECRHEEMMLEEEGLEKSDFGDSHDT